MTAAGVPTAAYATFTEATAAREYVKKIGAPVVVKADGLAAGKGVTVAGTKAVALAALDEAMLSYENAGARVFDLPGLRFTRRDMIHPRHVGHQS